jgi:hypothetical protein
MRSRFAIPPAEGRECPEPSTLRDLNPNQSTGLPKHQVLTAYSISPMQCLSPPIPSLSHTVDALLAQNAIKHGKDMCFIGSGEYFVDCRHS